MLLSQLFFMNYKKKLRYNVFNIGAKKNNVKIIELAKLFEKIFQN